MAKEQPRRARLKAERRRTRPRVVLHVLVPGIIVIDQGKRTDEIEAPPGTVIERPPAVEHTQPTAAEL